jgi:hypothetical protein
MSCSECGCGSVPDGFCTPCQIEDLKDTIAYREGTIAELRNERDKLFDSLRTQKHLNEQLGAWLNKAIAERDSWKEKAIDLAQGVLDYQEGKCDHYHLKKLVGRICPQ